jgi:Zn-dependent protease with chaperone function
MASARPVDRTPFFEFQARNRRATWRLTTAYAVVVGGCGVVSALGFVANLFLALFALAFMIALLGLGLGALTFLFPAATPLREPLWGLGTVPLRVVGGLPGLVPGEGRAIVVPGLLLPLACWLAVRAVWRAAGVGHVLLAIGARPPAAGDLEEQQLGNVVQEMAIAAGIPPPRVHLLDAGVANAAAVGSGLDDSHVVVGRRLLAELDREETEGLLAHLVGSIGNGDLPGAARIHSLLYLLELLIVVVLAPFARWPRHVAWRWFTFPLRTVGAARAARAEEARALIGLLEEHRRRFGAAGGGSDPVGGLGRAYLGWAGSVLVRICPPLLALLAFATAATGFLLLFASLPVGLLWRSRRYLADATAVELTRNPTGLYRGLRRLGEAAAAIPGGEAVTHLFIVGPPEGRARRATFSEREGLLMEMHPSLARRLRRLERMGAKPDS